MPRWARHGTKRYPRRKAPARRLESSVGCAAQNQLTPESFFLLRHFTGELQGIGDQFVAGFDAVANLLHSIGSETIGLHHDFAEALVAFFAEDPVLIVQAHDRGGGHDDAVRQLARAEGRHGVHAGTECAIGVVEHDANLRRTRVGIEHARNISDLALKSTIREGIQADLSGIAQMNFAQIVFEYIAHDPDLTEIGDGEQVGSVVETLDAFESCDVLLDNRAGYGSLQIDQRAGMRGVGAQDLHVMLRRFYI